MSRCVVFRNICSACDRNFNCMQTSITNEKEMKHGKKGSKKKEIKKQQLSIMFQEKVLSAVNLNVCKSEYCNNFSAFLSLLPALCRLFFLLHLQNDDDDHEKMFSPHIWKSRAERRMQKHDGRENCEFLHLRNCDSVAIFLVWCKALLHARIASQRNRHWMNNENQNKECEFE